MIDIQAAIAGGRAVAKAPEDRVMIANVQRGKDLESLVVQGNELGLSSADVLGAQAMTGVKELNTLPRKELDEAVKQAREVRRTDIALLSQGGPSNFEAQLAQELHMRGVTNIRYFDAKKLDANAGKPIYEGVGEVPMPEAFATRGAAYKRTLPLEDAGAHFGNLPSTRPITLSKSKQARVFAEHTPVAVNHPITKRDLKSADDVRAAAKELGIGDVPVVIKKNNGFGGQQVWPVKNMDELNARAAESFPDSEGPHSLLVQQYIDVGSADTRMTVVRGVDGKAKLASAFHRQGEGGIANGPNGSTYTRVPLEDVPVEERELAERAAESIGLDYAGVDLVKASDGQNYVLEVNGTPGVPELDLPFPRGEHTLPKLADWLVYGQR
jgi:hypothetical protein